ncbi:hypothetical protein [Glycomyces buryatensis]|nr:hypothetical protein [Glycomyces buryatensis]
MSRTIQREQRPHHSSITRHGQCRLPAAARLMRAQLADWDWG